MSKKKHETDEASELQKQVQSLDKEIQKLNNDLDSYKKENRKKMERIIERRDYLSRRSRAIGAGFGDLLPTERKTKVK